MSNAYHGERGEVAALRSQPALHTTSYKSSASALPRTQNRNMLDVTTQKARVDGNAYSASRKQLGSTMSSENSPPAMPFPSADEVAQSDLLQDNVFSTWKDNGDSETPETAEDLQKEDPLGTQIWKLYSKTKTRLPNQERMENLTWRMMAMNLKRREREQAL